MARFQKQPEYVTTCTLPVNLIDPTKKGRRGYRILSICGRRLTMAHVTRNECPACHRPLRDNESLAEERRSKKY